MVTRDIMHGKVGLYFVRNQDKLQGENQHHAKRKLKYFQDWFQGRHGENFENEKEKREIHI